MMMLACLCVGMSAEAKDRLSIIPDIAYSNSPARVKGVIKGYTTTHKEAVILKYMPFGGSTDEEVNAAISAMSPDKAGDGTFEFEITNLFTDRVTLSFRDKSVIFVLVPGEETTITIDMKLLYDEHAKKPAITFGGSMADFNTDFAKYVGEYDSTKPFAALVGNAATELVQTLTPEQYKTRLLGTYQEAARALNADKRISGAFKQYVNSTYQYVVLYNLFNFSRRKQLATQSTADVAVPDDYFAEMEEWQPFADNGMLYAFGSASQTATYATFMGNVTIGRPFDIPKALEQLMVATACMSDVRNNIPLKDEQVAALESKCPVLKDGVLKENAALLAHIEENRRNPQFFVKDFDPSLQGEDIFKALVTPYKGKPLLVDFWATWCGPCKAAMKTIMPLKEELKGKVNFIYVTGPTSPKEAWEAQIPDIHGDHYYVTDEQYSALLGQFESQGIPTYVVVDKEGGIVAKHIGYPGNDIIKSDLSK